MKVIIYTEGTIYCNCVILAKAISDVSTFYGSKNVYAAKELLIGKYDEQNPLEVELKDESSLKMLDELCREFHIRYEILNAKE